MESRILLGLTVAGIGFVAALMLVLPSVGRRGLLFGVWVGTDPKVAGRGRAIFGRWRIGVSAVSAIVLAVALLASRTAAAPVVLASAVLVQAALCTWVYLSAHRAALRLAPEGAAAAPPEVPVPSASSVAPLVAAGLAVAGAVAVFARHLVLLEDLPARIPVHFDLAGEADRWAARSPWVFALLPGLMAVLGVFLAAMASLVGQAKLSLRGGPGATRSVEAQMRFRAAVSHFLSGMAIVIVIVFGGLSWFQFESAMGAGPSPAWRPLALVGLVMIYAIGGVVWLLVRYGQGGARLEGAAADAPLTDGLADNRFWKAGLFYVNREDPSLLVEKRFGFGYTVNLGNPKALLLVAALFVAIAALILIAIAAG